MNSPSDARTGGAIVWLTILALGAACGQGPPISTAGDAEAAIQHTAVPSGPQVSGTLTPSGPPIGPPERIDAGGHCVIDLSQGYSVSGSLAGSMEIDFRIITFGPCPVAPPRPGTYDEAWIAHGTFVGTLEGDGVSATLTYISDVRAGGDVEGSITLADGLSGTLRIRGNFADGLLSYDGRVPVDQWPATDERWHSSTAASTVAASGTP